MNLVTPLNRVLGLGAAHGAVEHWWVQRLTAVALVPLGLWLLLSLAMLDDLTYETVVAWARRPVTGILLLLTSLALTYHSYLGLQVVIEDYLHAKPLKLGGLILSALGHAALAVAAIYSVLRITFGPLP